MIPEAIVVALLTAEPGAAPSPDAARLEAALGRRSLTATAVRGDVPVIVVDGRLDESVWKTAEVATDLVQRRPDPGLLATVRTEARFLYDDTALYVGVRLLDPAPEAIVAPYPRRDDETTSDWVFVEIDSRHDRRTAFSFGLNPRGVQADGAFQNDVDYDPSWDGVWEGAARIDASGWTAEYRIPFSQLVYVSGGPGSDDVGVAATFGVNVYRYTPRRGESSNWSPRLPSLAGIVSRFNDLHLRVPSHASRLQLVPHASAEARAPKRDPGDGASASGGLDLRAGLGSSFTLSAAVHPDFGQVEADPSEVNLTTLETLLTERRPLFVESAALFAFDASLPFSTRGDSFAAEQVFYSRRIGRPPRLSAPSSARVAHAPATSLLGAVKLTGRTVDGWSVGALASVTDREDARFVDEGGGRRSLRVEPVTASGVLRVTRDFREGRSAVGGMVTALGRARMTPALEALLPKQAFAAGLDGRHRFSDDRYEVSGFALASFLRGTPEALGRVLDGPGHYARRVDGALASPVGESLFGYGAQARFAKVGGEHWRWTLAGRAVSPRLELNDLGFQRNADWLVAYGALSYQEDRPGALFRRWSLGSGQVGGGWSFAGERRAAVVNLKADADFRNFWGAAVSFDHELPALQAEALRGGPALLFPSRSAIALSLYTDTRRPSQGSLDVRGMTERSTGGRSLTVAPSFTLRVSDRLAVTTAPSFDRTINPWQYVGAAAEGSSIRYLVGRLDQRTTSLTIRADLAFSPRLTLQVYAQPFASAGRFDRHGEVVAPRAARTGDRVRLLDPARVATEDGNLRIEGDGGVMTVPDPAYHVRSLRANVVLRWEYRPGSTLYAVWSQSRAAALSDTAFDAAEEAFRAFDARPANVFLVKISYWLAPRR